MGREKIDGGESGGGGGDAGRSRNRRRNMDMKEASEGKSIVAARGEERSRVMRGKGGLRGRRRGGGGEGGNVGRGESRSR